jgi:ferredoxin
VGDDVTGGDATSAIDDSVTVTVVDEADGTGDETTLTVERGTVLRDALLAADVSPYTRYTARLNCGGRGLCATCGVRIREDGGDHDPEHWHDRLADRFGYPRLSCQLRVTDDLTVAIPDKRVWGGRESE